METTAAALQTDTSYLGLRLPHPFIAGASPFGYHLDTIKRLEDAGCAAVVSTRSSKNKSAPDSRNRTPISRRRATIH
jgi:hypothetical protein